jgi:hypothetical protein
VAAAYWGPVGRKTCFARVGLLGPAAVHHGDWDASDDISWRMLERLARRGRCGEAPRSALHAGLTWPGSSAVSQWRVPESFADAAGVIGRQLLGQVTTCPPCQRRHVTYGIVAESGEAYAWLHTSQSLERLPYNHDLPI